MVEFDEYKQRLGILGKSINDLRDLL